MTRWAVNGALGLWALGLAGVIGSLMVNHVAAMPMPADLDRLGQGVAALGDRRGDLLVHIIYERCSCTDGLFDHLLARGPFDGAREVVLFVGDDAERGRRTRAAGFEFETIDRAALLDRFAVESAPLLVITRDGDLRYVGGYFSLPSAQHALDDEIWVALGAAAPVDPLPVFGCAVSEALRKRVDPLGLQGR